MTPQMEQLLKAMNQDVPKTKRILELNPDHDILKKLQDRFAQNQSDTVLSDYAQLLYGQALLAEGGTLPDPAQFSQLVAKLMVQQIN
jgi:molecular chaperone HtpG